MTRARQEAGFTVVELALAATISLIVFGVTLTLFGSLVRQRDRVEQQVEVETQARAGIDRLSRQLRNLASPADIITQVGSTQPKSVERNLPNDLVFTDIGDERPGGSANSANVRRVRYCLQTTGAVPGAGFTASPDRALVWAQIQTWTTPLPPPTPPSGDCPGTGWPEQRIVADHLTNAAQTPARDVFRYSGDGGLVTATTPEARETISRVEATVIVDEDRLNQPGAATLTSSVILRNQNRSPTAQFKYTQLLANSAGCTIQLNGSTSEDPESKPLRYEWRIDGVAQPEGVVLQRSVTPGTHRYELTVYDPAELRDTYTEDHPCPS